MKKLKLLIKKLPHAEGLPNPAFMSDRASGMDLMAAIGDDIVLKPLERVLIPTGIAVELPRGYEAQMRPRSGLAIRHGITLLNTPGTIDEDYRGEIKIILINLGQEPFEVKRGDRIAQFVLSKRYEVELVEVDELTETVRNAGGFGHTGHSYSEKK